MSAQSVIDEIARRLSELAAHSPAAELEKNARALLSGLLSKTNLVTRDEFEVQIQVLAQTRARLQTLEFRVAQWEKIRAAAESTQPLEGPAPSNREPA